MLVARQPGKVLALNQCIGLLLVHPFTRAAGEDIAYDPCRLCLMVILVWAGIAYAKQSTVSMINDRSAT